MIKILLIVLLIILYLSKRESFSNNIITFNSVNYKDRKEKTKDIILD